MRSNFIFSLPSLIYATTISNACLLTSGFRSGNPIGRRLHTHTRVHGYPRTRRCKKPNARPLLLSCVRGCVCTYKIIIYTTRRGGCPDLRARSRQSRRIRIPSSSHHNKRTIGLLFSDNRWRMYSYYYHNPRRESIIRKKKNINNPITPCWLYDTGHHQYRYITQ